MSTQDRLNRYLAAETEILEAQELRGGDRTYRMADLEEVRKAISDLERKLAREQSRAGSGRGLRFSLANLRRDP
jgi:hypothetical protein